MVCSYNFLLHQKNHIMPLKYQSQDSASFIASATVQSSLSYNLRVVEKLLLSELNLFSIQKLIPLSLLKKKDVSSNTEYISANRDAIITKAVGTITLLSERYHSLHMNNIFKLKNTIHIRRIGSNEVLCLERKQLGNNLGMPDIVSLANYLEQGNTLPFELQQLPIYHDALLYNAAKAKSIPVIGIEGKGLEYSKDSPYYHQAREEYMAEQLLAIARSGRNAIFLVGAAHINNLIKLLGAQGFRVDSNDASLGNDLITLKLNQAIFSRVLILPEVSANLVRIDNIEYKVETNSQPNTDNLAHEAIQSYLFFLYIHEFTEQLDLNWQIQKLFHLTDLWKFESLKTKYGITTSFDVFSESDSDFKKSVLLKLHPDKNLGNPDCKDDFIFVTNLREELNKPFDIQKFINEKIQTIQSFIYKANIGFKVFDTAVDTTRLIYIPTADNAKKVLIDTTYLYSMYSGVNGVSIIINGADVAYKAYHGEYNQALTQTLTTAGYMLIPAAISFATTPYFGFVYGATITIYSGYGAITNAYSLYQEYYEEDFGLKSIAAYKNIFETLSNSPFQLVYDFKSISKNYAIKLNDINYEKEKTHFKQQSEAKGEFGKKLYDYIHAPQLGEKYGLLNKILQDDLTLEETEALKSKYIQLTTANQSYDYCMEIKGIQEAEDHDHYYCYNEEQQILDHIVIIGEAVLEKISSL